jgi:hypothetical protein
VFHRRWATKVALIFHKLYDARSPIPRKLVDRYGAVDMRSTKAHNTSVFNCRHRNNVCIGCEWGGSSWPTDYKDFSATNR